MAREPLDETGYVNTAVRCARQGASAQVRESPLAPATNGALAKLAVGIATAGRPAVLAQMVRRLQAQTRPPDALIVCGPSEADLDGIAKDNPRVILATGPRGLARQRNAILRRLREFDLLVFFDDDFVPGADYLECFERIMCSSPNVVMTTGKVLKDGILGPGLTFEVADSILSQATTHCAADRLYPVYNGYGCNMGMRLAQVRRHGLAFDERLLFYGWLEDVDFSQQLARFGRVVRSDATRGVHLGIKLGRQSGTRLGYSQVANPLYLVRKGTMCWQRALYLMSRNLAANILRSLRPEPWVDRRGRLNGNARAFVDLMLGRLDPGRVTSL